MPNKTIMCTSTSCPSKEPHNSGCYNIRQAAMLMANATNILPPDIQETAESIFWIESSEFADHVAADWKVLAQFVAVHNGRTSGLLPKGVEKGRIWAHAGIQRMLKEGDKKMAAQRKADAREAAEKW